MADRVLMRVARKHWLWLPTGGGGKLANSGDCLWSDDPLLDPRRVPEDLARKLGISRDVSQRHKMSKAEEGSVPFSPPEHVARLYRLIGYEGYSSATPRDLTRPDATESAPEAAVDDIDLYGDLEGENDPDEDEEE